MTVSYVFPLLHLQIGAGHITGLAVAVVDLGPVAGLLQDDHGGAVLRAGHHIILGAGAGADIQSVDGVDDDGLFVGRQGAGGAGDGDAGLRFNIGSFTFLSTLIPFISLHILRKCARKTGSITPTVEPILST